MVPKQSLYILFFNALYNFALRPSYMLGHHWLFTLFLRRLASCSTCAQEEVSSTFTYLTTILLSNMYYCPEQHSLVIKHTDFKVRLPGIKVEIYHFLIGALGGYLNSLFLHNVFFIVCL